METVFTPMRHSRRPVVIAAAFWLVASASAVAGQGSTPAAMYERAQAKEQVARATEPPEVKDLRIAVLAYERIFRTYPRSGYADNALWQAAGLLAAAYEVGGDEEDREAAERWLEWLQKEYPSSPLAKKVPAEMQALARRATGVAPPPAAPAAANDPPAGPTSIRSVNATALPDGQRVTIEFTQEVGYTAERVDGPDRVYFDFKDAAIPSAVSAGAQEISGSFIKNVRIGHPTGGVTRFVLDLSGKPRYSAYALYDPFRLVIDVVDAHAPAMAPASRTPAASSPGQIAASTAQQAAATRGASGPSRGSGPSTPVTAPAPPAATRNGEIPLGRQLGLGVSRIVIDAGHGGHDPGAIANGVTEAEVTLDVAQRLAKLLTAIGGFQVVLTRDSNEFISLEERTAIVKRHDADLFLSIHVNASPDPSTRGIETYFLNLATNKDEAAVAARENAVSADNMRDFPDLVKAITLDNKRKESREFAAIVQTSMMRRMSQQNKALKDLGVKQAPFRVLIGADMPSVLAEISFLTNKNEATLLKQPTFRQRIAASLCDAIVSYQNSLKKVTTVAAREGGK
jgi:N-acetylmuramoyl-L-alanine amidase